MGKLSVELRPRVLTDVLGNEPVLRLLSRDASRKSTLFWGPAGCGKTTIAKIYGGSNLIELDAASTTAAGMRDAVSSGRCVLINEMQRLDKARQQILLAPMEHPYCVVLGTTTENPESILVDGLMSRFRCLKVEKPPVAQLTKYLIDVSAKLGLQLDPKVAAMLSIDALGVRDALDSLEDLIACSDGVVLSRELYESFYSRRIVKTSIESLKSALQKSIRGSDPDAACIYAHALLESGELNILCRRLRVIVCEDIGLAEPSAVSVVNACIESATKLGMPEAEYPILEAVIYLSMLPKSNSIGRAITACKDVVAVTVPQHIASPHPRDYLYPHDYPNHWVSQRYTDVPVQVYIPGDNKREQSFAAYWKAIKEGNGEMS